MTGQIAKLTMQMATMADDDEAFGGSDRLDVLDWAATLLLAAGCADPIRVRSTVRLPCLDAAEQLRAAGGRARRALSPVRAERVRDLLRAALHELDTVPAPAADLPAVREATAATRAALAELG